MFISNFRFIFVICLVVTTGSFAVSAASSSYYTQPPRFQPSPTPDDKKPWNVKNFGPVGIGIDLTKPGFTMVISSVEKGSPAEKTGQLKTGQVIESINDQVLKDRDPREILGDILTEAEATDGKVRFKIRGAGEVVVSIPVLGRYSKTWPVNCPKSDKIVRNLADLLGKRDKPTWGGIIFLLSTGEEKDLQVVRRWMKNYKAGEQITWQVGCQGVGICEYYLRTGDTSVLPEIKAMSELLKKRMYNGGWSGRGGPAAFTYSTGTGQLHAAGVHAYTFLLMARLCGVDVDEYTLLESLKQFYRFAGHGNVAYGDGPPEGGFRDNGKTSGMAMGMAAAALLAPEGEKSIYAKARDISAMKAFYANPWFHAAHTGGGIGEAWHHMAIGLIRDKRPNPYHTYLDARRWMMDLSRRFDGSIGIAGMADRYDASASESDMDWGTYLALTYTIPRKQLQMFGAPRSKWAKTYPLPVRPWGNAADDIFLSTEPIKNPAISVSDLLNEKVTTDDSAAIFARLKPGSNDALFMKYFHHPEFDLRVHAINMATAGGRYQDIVPFLKSDDARLRHVGVLAIAGMFKGKAIPDDKLTPEMMGLVEKMVDNPNESWWVTKDAIEALGRADKATIGKHRDRLIALLETRDDMWTKAAAAVTLSKICTEPAHYQVVLPKVFKAKSSLWNNTANGQLSWALEKAMGSASPEVKAFAVTVVKQAYQEVPDDFVAKGGARQGAKAVKISTGKIMKQLPGGTEFILQLPKKTMRYAQTGEDKDLFIPQGFKFNPQFVGKWLFLTHRYDNPMSDQMIQKVVDDALKQIAATKAKNLSGRGAYRAKHLILEKDGKVQREERVWTDDKLVDNNLGEARQMAVRTVGGKQYLLVEMGTYPEDATEDWKCGWQIYSKEP